MKKQNVLKEQVDATEFLLFILNGLMWRVSPWKATDKIKLGREFAKRFEINIDKFKK